MLNQHTPISFRLDGRPIFGFSGAEGEGDGGGDGGQGGGQGDGGNQPDPNAIGPDGLTEAGRAAITAERNNTRAAKADLRTWKAVGAEFGLTTPEAIKEALSKAATAGTQQAPVVDEAKIRQEAEAAAATKADRRVARANVMVLATETFADPEDAISALGDEDLDDLLDRNGALNKDAAKQRLAEILARKPHWAKIQKERPPEFDGGSRNTSGGAQQGFADFVRGQVRAKRGG